MQQLDLLGLGANGKKPAPTSSDTTPKLSKEYKGDHVVRSAWLSDDFLYRWTFTRWWKPGPVAVVSGLNPSTADAFQDDPTMMTLSAQLDLLGYGSYLMLNIFAFRATDPRDMKAERDPVGVLNDEVFERALAAKPKLFIAAWGLHGKHLDRDLAIMRMLRKHDVTPMCFAITMSGMPRHPLYLPHGTTLKPYPGRL